nr:palindromic element RPE5 domain-containing protein [Rickettsia monacensis]
MEKSKESVSRGAERILNVQHPRTYKDDIYSHAFKNCIEDSCTHVLSCTLRAVTSQNKIQFLKAKE